ncbi:MAG: tetratricopeptide repeat protein [Helicobacteraceae bacterium]
MADENENVIVLKEPGAGSGGAPSAGSDDGAGVEISSDLDGEESASASGADGSGDQASAQDEPGAKDGAKLAPPPPKNKLHFYVFLGALAVVFALFLTLWLLFDKNDETYGLPNGSFIAKNLEEKELIRQDLAGTDIERIISKATFLYDKGDYQNAMDLFNKVSIYNQSLSLYNLGVVSMKKEQYKQALEYFQKAINTNENRCESAINAGVCALVLKDTDAFKYYLDLAYDALPEKVNSPIYPYLYTLINYYRNRPVQVIAAGADVLLKDYEGLINSMLAKSYFTLGDLTSSVKYFEKTAKTQDLLNLGLMSARIGEYDSAIAALKEAVSKKVDTNKSQEALVLSYLKNGDLFTAGTQISGILKKKDAIGHYPIDIQLKSRLFDIDLIQDFFSKNLLLDEETTLGIFFYFMPYKITDLSQNVRLIQKGEISINASDIASAQKYLENSLVLSGINKGLMLGIKLALDNKIISANEIFKKIEKDYTRDSVLEYNLALSYAQLGDYFNAYNYFSRSYFLDRKNKLAGVLSVILSSYAGANERDNLNDLVEYLQKDAGEDSKFYFALISLYKNNHPALLRWLELDKPENARNLLLDIFAAYKLGKQDVLVQRANKLLSLYPNDFLAKVLATYARASGGSIKAQAFAFQDLIQRQDFRKDGLYYGSDISRDLYIKLALITGNLRKIRQDLKDRMQVEVLNPKALMQAVALVDVYLGFFEEAFVIYSDLIDRHEITDTKTMLLASVAAIGAGHKANAIALLDLAIKKNKRNFEARYGLALLYMETANYSGAAIQLNNIDDGKFISRYYDFKLRH